MKKRIFAILLAVLCVVTSCPMEALADEILTVSSSSEVDCTTGSVLTHINPEYADTISISDLPTVDTVSAAADVDRSASYVSLTTALKQLREQMIDRSNTITLYMKVYDSSIPSGTSCGQYAFDLLIAKVFNHTGDPEAGDYLERHYGGCKASYRYWDYDGYYNVEMTFSVAYHTTLAQENALDAQVEAVLADLDLDGCSDFEKAREIYDYICNNVVYDYSNADDYMLKYTAYAAMMHGTAVCQGYASLFYRMALEVDLDARYIRGYANGGNHGWNIVRINDRYYNVDATWDADYAAYGWAYKYFLVNDANFSDHTRRDEYLTSEFYAKYPMSSSNFNLNATPLYISSVSSNVYVKSGKTAKIEVDAVGTGLAYQWWYKDSGSDKYSRSSTVTGDTYSVAMNSNRMNRLVYCVVTDAYNNAVRTKTFQLRMDLSITQQPKAKAAAEGTTVSTTVKVAGYKPKYQWYIKDVGAAKFTKSSVTSATYAYKMTAAKSGRQVYCVITDGYGDSVKTQTVTLSMITVTAQPKTTYTKQGVVAKTTVKADGNGLKYQWYVKNAGGTSYTKSSNTTATYSVKMSSTSKDRLVYCIVKDKYGNSVKTNTVRLRMAATITTQPKSVTVAKGKTAKVTLNAVGDGLTYTWYYKNAGAAKFVKTTAFTGKSYSVAMNASRDGRQIYCVVKDKYGKTAKSNTVTLSMPAIYLNESGTKYHYDKECAGTTAYKSTLSTAIKLGKEPCSKCVG